MNFRASRSWRGALLGAVASVFSFGADAARAPDIDERPPILTPETDPGASRSPVPQPSVKIALDQLRGRVPTVEARIDLRGRVRALSAPEQALSPPRSLPARTIAGDFLLDHAALLGVATPDLSELRPALDAAINSSGARSVRLMQQVDGIDIWGAELRVVLDGEGRVLSVGNSAEPNVRARVNLRAPLLSAEQAIGQAASSVGLARSAEQSTPRLVHFPLSDSSLRLAWRVMVQSQSRGPLESYETLIDAADGRVLFRRDRVEDASPRGLVFQVEAPVDHLPFKTNPAPLNREFTNFDGGSLRFPPVSGSLMFAPGAPHFDWWAGERPVSTFSNNVIAFASSLDENFNFEDRTVVSSGSDFLFPLDLNDRPSRSIDAATVNAFFWMNHLHDVSYRYGFTEVWGNFQQNNFGLGGLAEDALSIYTRPFLDCNASASLSDDGDRSIIEMYKCYVGYDVVGYFVRDTALDTTILAHEFHHEMAHRLDPTLHQGQQGRGMGEGGGDFLGLLFTVRPGDSPTGFYGTGGYGLRDDYRTIRRNYYSLRSVDRPDGPQWTYGDIIENTNSPHPTGEIWAHALWYARTHLVERHGFVRGTEIALRLLIDGYKLSTPNPDFLDQRNAIVLADRVNNGGANRCLLWSAFARMGMGQSAISIGNADITPIEAFDVPADCRPQLATATAPVDFGIVSTTPLPGESNVVNRNASICNRGSAALFVTRVVVGGRDEARFRVLPPAGAFPAEIAVDACLDFGIRYTATTTGVQDAAIRIDSNDPAQPSVRAIELSATGTSAIPQATPLTLDFGSVPVNLNSGERPTFQDRTVQLRNAGTSPLRVDKLEVGSGDSSDFRFVSAPTLPVLLQPGDSYPVGVRFTPTALGLRQMVIRYTTHVGTAQSSVFGTGIARSNLALQSLRATPAAVVPGGSVTVEDLIANTTAVAAAGTRTRYRLSRDTVDSPDDLPLTAQRLVPPLAQSQASSGSVNVFISNATALGRYQVIACADADDVVPETREDDNCRATPLDVSRPDLTVASVQVTNTPRLLARTVQLTTTVANAGLVAAPATVTRYVLSRDAVLDARDLALTPDSSTPPLAAGASQAIASELRPPAGTLLAGAYFVIACTDVGATVVELDEQNNCRATATSFTFGLR